MKRKTTKEILAESFREPAESKSIDKITVKQFVKDNADKIGTVENVSTAALIESSFGQMQKLASGAGVKLCEKEFHCSGKFSALHAGHPDEADLKAAKEFARSVIA